MSALREEKPRNRRMPYVVGVRDGRIVRLKVCPECEGEKVCSDGPESDYWPRKRNGKVVGWQAYCKPCTKDLRARYGEVNGEKVNAGRRRRHAERMATDPDYHDRHNEASARATAKWLQDPENRERDRVSRRNSQRRAKRKSPVRWRETKRMEYALRRERLGKPVRPRVTVIDNSGPRAPAEPFREWFEAYRRMSDAFIKEAALELGLTERYATRLREKKFKTTEVDIVSRALTNARFVVYLDGRPVITINDLYGEDFSVTKAKGVRC